MKTSDLITALVEDRASGPPFSGLRLSALGIVGLALSLAIFGLFLGVRADFRDAVRDPHVLLKFVFAASLVAALLPVAIAATRPEARLWPLLRLVAVPLAVLFCGIAFQLLTSPPDFWISGMIGRYPVACLRNIPALVIGPLAVLVMMLRAGAPTKPVLAGAVSGALAGGVGAFIYALHCPDDSALFVALWYSLAIGSVSLLGAVAARLAARW